MEQSSVGIQSENLDFPEILPTGKRRENKEDTKTPKKWEGLSNAGLGTYSDRAIALHTPLTWSPLPASREHPDCGVWQVPNKWESHYDPHPPLFCPLHYPHFGSRHPHLHWLVFIPGRNKVAEFGNMQTSGASIVVHAIIYFALITIFCIAIGVHIYTSQ
ncbi:hypothetical protein CRYUN_Cryun13aG0016100 [Craigia yunnanensis]